MDLPFKKMLVPHDGTKHSDRALDLAVELARNLKDVQIVLLHVVEPMPTPVMFGKPRRSRKTGRAITMSEHIEELYEALEESGDISHD